MSPKAWAARTSSLRIDINGFFPERRRRCFPQKWVYADAANPWAVYLRGMFREAHGESVAAAQRSVDYALAALSHTYCPTWKGSASVACADNLTQIVGLGSEVYRQLHVLRVRLEMIEQLRAEVLATAALQGVG